MKKSIIFTLIVFFSLTATFSTANANFTKPTPSEEKMIMKQLNLLQDELDFEIVDLDQTTNTELLNFDSIEDFKVFVNKSKETQKFTKTIDTSLLDQPEISIASINDSHVINWYSYACGSLGGVACWKNIAFSYKYKFVNGKPQFISVSNINSYITGLNVAWWNETAQSHNIVKTNSTKDTVKIKIHGQMVIGISIKGLPVGAKISDIWEGSLRIY